MSRIQYRFRRLIIVTRQTEYTQNREWRLLRQAQLSALPDGIFEGLVGLERVDLRGNPGAVFALGIELEKQDAESFVVKAAHGVPFDYTLDVSAFGGTLSTNSVRIGVGGTRSQLVTITPYPGVTQVVVSAGWGTAHPKSGGEVLGVEIGFAGGLTLDMLGGM